MKIGLNLFVGQLIAMILVIVVISIGVIFSFYYTNHQILLNNEKLMLEEKEKNLLGQIRNYVYIAIKAEKGFYANPNNEEAMSVIANINLAIKSLQELKNIYNNEYDTKELNNFKKIGSLLRQYQTDYKNSLSLWKKRGFSRESGIGLKLRTIAYSDVRSFIPKYETQLLQGLAYKLRWLEYEFYLYGKKYLPKINTVLAEFNQELLTANLENSLYQQLKKEIESFQLQMDVLDQVRNTPEKHRSLEKIIKNLSTIINTHSITNFAYLFRTLVYYEMEYRELGQQSKHVSGIKKVLIKLKLRIKNASINSQDKNKLLTAMDDYEDSFIKLVDYDKKIGLLKNNIATTLTKLDTIINDAIIDENEAMKKIRIQAMASNNFNTRLNIVVMIVLLIIMVFLIVRVVIRLGGKVKKIGSGLAQISEGDLILSVALPKESKRDELDCIIQHIMNVSEKLNLSINDLEKRNKELEVISNKLAKYLSPQVYKSIFSGQKMVKIQSGRKKLTVFFSDIVGFTNITDTMESEELTVVLNEYLNEMSLIALEYGGTIDKFIGDAIMIFFGDPHSLGARQDSFNCVSMAIAMQKKIIELNPGWQYKYGFIHKFQVRMGIATGYCTVGNFGSEERMDYTIMGGIVNLASRLEHHAEVDEILISEETYTLVQELIHCSAQDKIHLKGIAQSIQSFQVEGFVQKGSDPSTGFEQSGLGYDIKIKPELLTDIENSKLIDYLQQLIKKL
jgi:adenylate cyclase